DVGRTLMSDAVEVAFGFGESAMGADQLLRGLSLRPSRQFFAPFAVKGSDFDCNKTKILNRKVRKESAKDAKDSASKHHPRHAERRLLTAGLRRHGQRTAQLHHQLRA